MEWSRLILSKANNESKRETDLSRNRVEMQNRFQLACEDGAAIHIHISTACSEQKNIFKEDHLVRKCVGQLSSPTAAFSKANKNKTEGEGKNK